MPSITVFLSASTKIAPIFYETARELGREIARRNHTLVYGGNHVGPMGELADGARDFNGRVVGITPHFFNDDGVADSKADELILVDTMRQRKAILEERGDAFCVLPGGVGTLEEFIECLVARTLEQHFKPIVLINTAGFWNPLVDMLRQQIETGFVRKHTMELFDIVESPAAAVALIESRLKTRCELPADTMIR